MVFYTMNYMVLLGMVRPHGLNSSTSVRSYILLASASTHKMRLMIEVSLTM